jgi:peptidoglycan/LPS O-acetylase OafA/YrhL
VRGLAILLVMQLHFWGMGFTLRQELPTAEIDKFVAKLAGTGWAGVELFFVLSGFLITRILVTSKGSAGYFRIFYIRRALRIFPAYFGFLTFTLLVLPHLTFLELSDDARQLRGEQLWLWTYTLNVAFSFHEFTADVPITFVHLWSLAFEEQFYLAWPVLVALLGRRHLTAFCIALILGSLAMRVAISSSAADEIFTAAAPRQLVPAHCDTIALGALLALVSRDAGGLASWRPNVLLGIGGAVIVLITLFITKDGLALRDRSVQTVGFAALTILCGGVVYAAITAREKGLAHRLFSSPMLAALGRYSYAMYLIHIFVGVETASVIVEQDLLFTLAESQIPANVAVSVVASGVTFAVAWVSWQLFESRILALKDRVPYGRPLQGEGAQPQGSSGT